MFNRKVTKPHLITLAAVKVKKSASIVFKEKLPLYQTL